VSTLVVPSDPAALAVLGPRITPQTVARLRRIACPTSAAALLLALATDARAGASGQLHAPQHQPRLRAGRAVARHLPRPRGHSTAATRGALEHQTRGLAAYALFAHHDGGLLLTRAMAHRIGHAATLADLPLPHAATAAGRSDSKPEAPFATALINSGAVQIDDAGPPPRPRSHQQPTH
jgi:hypothetical protein